MLIRPSQQQPLALQRDQMDECDNGEVARVVFVVSHAAKTVKTHLENDHMIRRDLRLTTVRNNVDADNGMLTVVVIAVPLLVLDEAYESKLLAEMKNGVVRGFGYYKCPYSSATLGNHNVLRRQNGEEHARLNLVQTGLLQAVKEFLRENQSLMTQSSDATAIAASSLERHIESSSSDFCPTKLELMGDDRTVVVPLLAFQNSASLSTLLGTMDETWHGDFQSRYLWRNLANVYSSRRVVWRGEVDPNSPTRQSGYSLLWADASSFQCTSDATAATGQAASLSSPSTWITVTEQGIRQSFDFTRVMFSRGNITEKIRFGQQLVQPNEVVLDMYAGIGYFTLPALLHGRAAHVYCCEWNEDALQALRYNLRDNGVHDSATVLAGDCRVILSTSTAVAQSPAWYGRCDRISLGLLPSSEGGWPTAVAALHRERGGWLHIHGNVPVSEVHAWAVWVSCRIRDLAIAGHNGWIAAVVHIEKVKSFAPRVNHYVADVWVGPPSQGASVIHATIPVGSHLDRIDPGLAVVVASKYGPISLLSLHAELQPPSCALSKDGILHQAWMRN
jgi:Met-10+ like-protein